jgi:hypothetical protein
MIAKFAKINAWDRRRAAPLRASLPHCNDNRTARAAAESGRLAKPVLVCRWQVAPATGRLECSWHRAPADAACADEPGSGRARLRSARHRCLSKSRLSFGRHLQSVA